MVSVMIETIQSSTKKECDYECRDMNHIEDTLSVIRGKWKILIILSLATGLNRFSEIAKSIPNITLRMLSKELKEMERSLLVKRTVYPDSPIRITYELTPFATTLQPLINEMIKWGETNGNHHKKY